MHAHGSTSVLVHFRKSGRELLKSPSSTARHLKRLQAALQMEGREPLQGALSDTWHACEDGPAVAARFLSQSAAAARLGQRLAQTVRRAALGGQPLARVNPLATRWSILTIPSLGSRIRSWLCSPDDSRAIAAEVLGPILAGDEATEQLFLAHCTGAADVLAFMLVRQELKRAGHRFSQRWANAFSDMQRTACKGTP